MSGGEKKPPRFIGLCPVCGIGEFYVPMDSPDEICPIGHYPDEAEPLIVYELVSEAGGQS